MRQHEEIVLRNSMEELDRLAQAVEEFADTCSLPVKAVFETNLVLEEVVTNVISYGYEEPGEHSIRVELEWEKPWLRIQISDDGKPFNPLDLPPPDLEAPLEDRDVGGLGIHFIRQLMSQVAYERQGGRNVLLLGKEWPESA